MENAAVSKGVVLVVDDQVQNLQLVASIIGPLYSLMLTDSAAKVLPYTLKKKPDLILLDVMMPEISGFDVCRQLKEHPETRDIPVIFLTAMTGEDDIAAAYEAGGVDYISKPFRTRELLARIAAHMTIKRQHDSIAALNAELLEMNKQKDRLLGVIAHDMRGSIGSMGNVIDILLQDIESMTPVEIRDYMQMMRNASERVYSMFDGLLMWAKSKFQTIDFECSVVELDGAVAEAVAQVATQAANKHIRIETSVECNVPLYVDYMMLLTVLRNLLTNALKFSHPHSTVKLMTTVQGDWAEFQIVDSGVGMPDDVRERLFSSNSIVSSPGTKGEKGTGLGLDVCGDFVRRHGGAIHVESEEGKGSTFRFTMPLWNKAVMEAQK